MASAACIDVAIEMRSGAQGEFEEALAKSSNKRPELRHRREDIWALLYTSGTTGRPKGAQITFGMALCNAIVLGQQFRIGEDSRNLVALPTFHTAGLNVFANPVFFAGGANLVVREFDAPLIIDLLRGKRGAITHLMGVPTTHSMLIETPGFDEIARTVREVCVAGAPCPASTIKSYADVGLVLRQCWGMTEVGPLGLFMPRRPPEGKEASSGRPGIFARHVVADADGRPLPDGEIGELLVKGPAVTSGYWEKPEANAAAFNADGWFRTGDACYRDEEGYFFIVDRWKDMYISGGENVYPAEIERTLDQLDEIIECAVVGMPDPKWGEVGCAFVVQKDEAIADASQLQRHCEQRLARYKIPKKFVFVDQLPRNASGKVLKVQLKQRVLQSS
jgi:fatty-acyl-CoA synthase